MTIYKRTNSDDADFLGLVALLDADLAIRDGVEHSFYAQFNSIQSLQQVIICYVDEEPAGCGAFKPYSEEQVEIKRLFVQPGLRGHGLGFYILKELELWAAEFNFTVCILETGKKQPEAIRLYTKAGYSIIPNYGQYENIANSVCMKKDL